MVSFQCRMPYYVLLVIPFLFISCGDETTTDPPDTTSAVAQFTLPQSAAEGEAFTVTNTSTDATFWAWSITPGDVTSTDKEPEFELLEEGTYTVRLIATGDGSSDTAEQTIVITPDRSFRAFGKEEKLWHVSGVYIEGTLFTQDPCFDDNTMWFSRAESRWNLRDNDLVCQTPIFSNQGGPYSVDEDLTEIMLYLDEFEGMAVNDSVQYYFGYLSHDSIAIYSIQEGLRYEICASTRLRTE